MIVLMKLGIILFINLFIFSHQFNSNKRVMNSVVRACRIMTNHEKFFFDLNGFIILRNILTPEEVSVMNTAIDVHTESIRARDTKPLKNTAEGSALSAPESRLDLGGNFLSFFFHFIWFILSIPCIIGMLGWESPHGDMFRRLLVDQHTPLHILLRLTVCFSFYFKLFFI